jgi:hypothetical protein
MGRKIYIFLLLGLAPLWASAQQHVEDSLVEVSGVTLTADSSLVIPNVNILIQGKSRGTMSNDDGVFSIVAFKGEVLVFSAVGFKTKKMTIPSDLAGHHLGVAQLMDQDTTYLPVTVVRSYPSREEFGEAFLHWKIPDNQYDIARANTELSKLRALIRSTPMDGSEGVNQTFNQQFQQTQYKGGFPAMNIFNPFAWAKFIKAIKDGDFKSRD